MDSVVDLAESRKAREEKSEQVRDAALGLMEVLETHRSLLSEEFMAFLLAMAVSDQALYYADEAASPQAGNAFMDNLFNTARQLFESQQLSRERLRTESAPKNGPLPRKSVKRLLRLNPPLPEDAETMPEMEVDSP